MNAARTEEVDGDSAPVAGVVLDLVRRIEVLDVRVHLSVSPDRRHQLVAYLVVSVLRRCGSRPFNVTTTNSIILNEIKEKGKEEYLYSAFLAKVVPYTQSAQAWITQFYLQITPCLPFLRERSPDVTTTATEAADVQLQLTTHLSTPKG